MNVAGTKRCRNVPRLRVKLNISQRHFQYYESKQRRLDVIGIRDDLGETRGMKSEAKLLNLICILAAIAFVGLAALNALFSASFLTTDNLFVTMVCLLMALMFAANPLLYLRDEGRLRVPFRKKPALNTPQLAGATPPLLDAKGRAVPADVRSMVANMKQKQP
ncbi:MAG: hypothetical protein ABR501_12980 [Pyrinomonadaceae bacterium]